MQESIVCFILSIVEPFDVNTGFRMANTNFENPRWPPYDPINTIL